MTMPPQVPNRKLRSALIPSQNADWAAVERFALTFNGYEYWGSNERCGDIANARRQSTLTEIRTCLFFEQRRWRHIGEHPDAEAWAYIQDLMEQIRSRVALAERLLV
jgi:hypothetical protein